MKKGQVCMEALSVVGVALIVYAGVVWLSLRLHEEAADRGILEGREAACRSIAASVDAVFASGPGSRMAVEVPDGARVVPGLVELGTTNGTYLCTIATGAVNGTWSLAKRAYVIENRGGKVGFR